MKLFFHILDKLSLDSTGLLELTKQKKRGQKASDQDEFGRDLFH